MQTVSQLESLTDQPLLFILALVFGLPQAQAPSAPPSRANSLVIPALSVTTLLSTRNQVVSVHTCVLNRYVSPTPSSPLRAKTLGHPAILCFFLLLGLVWTTKAAKMPKVQMYLGQWKQFFCPVA